MVQLKPMDEVPGSTGNDVVYDNNFNLLFDGQPLDVYNYLLTPGNMGDTTQVQYSPQSPSPWGGQVTYASQYLEVFSEVYPDVVLPGI